MTIGSTWGEGDKLSLENCEAIEKEYEDFLSWDMNVEVVMEHIIQLKKRAGGLTNMGKPKLDSDGCLILKRI